MYTPCHQVNIAVFLVSIMAEWFIITIVHIRIMLGATRFKHFHYVLKLAIVHLSVTFRMQVTGIYMQDINAQSIVTHAFPYMFHAIITDSNL